MQESFRHCEELLRGSDKDRYLATLFAPASARAPLFALYAFDLEIRRIPDRVRDPLAGELRLQWWREAIEGRRDEEARANPVAAALLSTMREHALSSARLVPLLEARTLDFYADSFPSLDALRSYAEQTAGCVLRGATQILVGSEGASVVPEEAAVALTFTDALRTLGHDAAHGRVRLPADLLLRHTLTPSDVLARQDTPALREALTELREQAERSLARALDAIPSASVAARPALLPLGLLPDYLRALAEAGRDPFAPVEVAQWRRQLSLWRTARRWRRAQAE